MTDIEILELNRQIAEKVMLEPEPIGFPQEWEMTFSNYLDGTPTESSGKNWIVVHLYEHDDEQEWIPKFFATNPKMAFVMEQKIIERELMDEYVFELAEVVIGTSRPGVVQVQTGLNQQELFALIHATPEERCLAALKAVETDLDKQK